MLEWFTLHYYIVEQPVLSLKTYILEHLFTIIYYTTMIY